MAFLLFLFLKKYILSCHFTFSKGKRVIENLWRKMLFYDTFYAKWL